jgi:hypothetical protein
MTLKYVRKLGDAAEQTEVKPNVLKHKVIENNYI